MLSHAPALLSEFPQGALGCATFADPSSEKGHGSLISVHDSAPGINLVGFLTGAFGLGESARQYAKALKAARIPVALIDLDVPGLPHARTDTTFAGQYSSNLVYSTTIICVNPDWWERALRTLDPAELARTEIHALWFWELPDIPDSWLPFVAEVAGFIAPSAFVADALKKITTKPIVRIPLPIDAPPELMNRAEVRNRLGIPHEGQVFLTTFDFNSFAGRKNPGAVVQAFRQAFPPETFSDGVRLLIKTSNGRRHPIPLSDLSDVIEGDSRISLYDEVISRRDFHTLLQCADAYISLHRSEGFGLGMAESMAAGVPVIATGWSGNMDFMHAENSFPVSYQLVPVAEGEYPDSDGKDWADPDLQSAAMAMSLIASQDALVRSIVANGVKTIRSEFSASHSGKLFREWILNRNLDRVSDDT